jgi:predicted phage tail protein
VPENLQTLSNGNVVVNFKVPKGSVEGRQTLVVSDGGGATASDYFTVTEKILATPQPISPQKDTTLRSGVVTFRWGAATGGSNNVTYTLQISSSPDLATYVRSISGLQTSSYTVSEEEPLDKGNYYWWVKAVDSYDNESPWSDSGSFNVSPIPTWVWAVIGVVILIVLMAVAYRETKFRVTE